MSELFKDCMGPDFLKLDPIVQQAHTGTVQLTGTAQVERGKGLATIICLICGMPPSMTDSHLIVDGEHLENVMLWKRQFNDFKMNSHFYKSGEYLIEKLGPIHLSMRLEVNDGALIYRLAKSKVFGIPVPGFLAPKVIAEEKQVDDIYRFKVHVALPIIGKLVHYWGDMHVETLEDK